ncbi:MAG: hypothetical protein IJ689_04850, partial [Alphaproteobacteria bacterium]|nr:hypothetical protein [Alphaproteobacteria bacterium]
PQDAETSSARQAGCCPSRCHQLPGVTGLSISLTAGLDPAIQVYNLANCFTWTPHQVRRDIEGKDASPLCHASTGCKAGGQGIPRNLGALCLIQGYPMMHGALCARSDNGKTDNISAYIIPHK